MAAHPNRDPLTLLLLTLILLALVWIGFGVMAQTVESRASAYRSPAAAEEFDRTLKSLNRILTSLPTGGIEWAPAQSAGERSDRRDTPSISADVRQELKEIRALLATKSAASRSPSDYANFIDRATAMPDLDELFRKLTADDNVVDKKARQELLLMDRGAILKRYGKPNKISVTRGAEYWYYNLPNGRKIWMLFHDGFLVNMDG